MTGVAVYVAIATAIAGLLCGHQGEDFPPIARPFRRRTRRPAWARGPIRARRYAHQTRQEPT